MGGDQASTSPPAHDTRETLQAQSREDPLSQADNGSVPEVPLVLDPATELPMELYQGDQASTCPPAHDTPETLQAQSREDPPSQASSAAEEPPSDLDPAHESPMELSQGDLASTRPPWS